MTEPELRRYVRLWRSRLGLYWWHIDIRHASQSEMRNVLKRMKYANVEANCYYAVNDYEAKSRTSLIYIAPPGEMEAFDKAKPMKDVVLHELAHIVFDPEERRSKYDQQYEDFLDANARAWRAFWGDE